MTTSDRGDPGPPSRTFRQTSALISGAILVVVAGLFILAWATGDNRDDLEPMLWPLALLLSAWALLLRPSVKLTPHGVELHNIVRKVLVTWSAIDMVESRWVLTVVTHEGKACKAFAISAQRPKRGSSATTTPDGKVRAFGALAPADPENLAHRPGSAGDVAQRVMRVVEEYERGTKAGHIDEVEPRAQVRPAYPGIVAVVASLACVVGALLG